ncbi:MAG: DUF2027 domain-containing protein [Cyclobacteriaceae bacterium]|nr:DUF2027 domain-containing protein [Cyclobacteriaceae bacterium]MCH8517007.1 DUF2027 domain-containing protein [Cyclobacteriaceae bacterium]
MKIGDIARVIRGTEEGKIVKIIDAKTVEIEIEDGFSIPVLKSDLVVVASEERDFLDDEPSEVKEKAFDLAKNERRPSSPLSDKGVYLVFEPLNDQDARLCLVNQTVFDVPFVLSEKVSDQLKGIASGVLVSDSFQSFGNYKLSNFDQWPIFFIQALFFKTGYYLPRNGINLELSLSASKFFKSKAKLKYFQSEVWARQIDENIKATDLEKLKTKFKQEVAEDIVEEAIIKDVPPKPLSMVPKEVDLHIEALVEDFSRLSNADMLKIQLKEFEDKLNLAITCGADRICFIHGVGKGTLKREIQKRLADYTNIQYKEQKRTGLKGPAAVTEVLIK